MLILVQNVWWWLALKILRKYLTSASCCNSRKGQTWNRQTEIQQSPMEPILEKKNVRFNKEIYPLVFFLTGNFSTAQFLPSIFHVLSVRHETLFSFSQSSNITSINYESRQKYGQHSPHSCCNFKRICSFWWRIFE